MSRERELYKNTIILGIGKFLPKLVSIITLPIITACLTKSEYGSYDLISTLVMLIMPISTLQIQSAAFRFLIDSRNDTKKSQKIITNIMFVIFPISLLAAIIVTIYYFFKYSIILAIAIGLYFFIDNMYITISQIARGLAYNKIYSCSSIIISLVNAVSIVLSVYYLKMGLLGVIISLIVANLSACIVIIFKINILSYIKIKYISFNCIKELINYSWPMIPNNLSNWILKLSDRLIITAYLGIEANAIYAVANKIPNLLSIAQSVFVMAWQENASISINDANVSNYYTQIFNKVFSLLYSFTIILIAFTPILFFILIRGNYLEAYIQMPILILGMFFYCMSAFQGGIYIAHKKTKSVGYTTIFSAIINLVVDFLLIEYIGITAGSISTLIAYFILYVYRMFDSLKFQKMNYNIKEQIVLILIMIFMLYLCSLQNLICDIINIFISILLSWFLNINYIKNFVKGVNKYVKAKRKNKEHKIC